MKSLKSLENRVTYMVPPTWEQIEEFIEELNISFNQFERFYGIPFNYITQIKSGTRPLPSYAWHFVYEKIKPSYGIGKVSDYYKPTTKKKLLTKPLTPKSELHGRLTGIVEDYCPNSAFPSK